MNRGSYIGCLAREAQSGQSRFNEAPIHESGKSGTKCGTIPRMPILELQ